MKALKKVDAKLKFLYRQNKYLTPTLKILLCNALIQPRFDYVMITGERHVSPSQKILKHKLQAAQNKCMRIFLDLLPRSYLGATHFRKINSLQVSERVKSCIVTTDFKYWNEIVIIGDMFQPSLNRFCNELFA